MTILQPIFRIEEESKKDVLLEVIADKYCREILNSIMDKSKSAMEITDETKIPISTVYRRIQELCDARLLATSGSISGDGKKFFLYKSKIKSVQSIFNGSKVEVEMVFN